jgi:hypothetical protein
MEMHGETVKCTLCIRFTFYTALVLPDGDLLMRPKHVSVLSTYAPSCVDCYCVIINLKHNGTSD